MNFRLTLLTSLLLLTIHSTAQQKPSAPPATSATSYHNDTFNFRYQVPYGWVDRTQALQQDGNPSQGQVLLAVFERPPQTLGDSINSAVVVASEKIAGLKKASDYLAPLIELTAEKGFHPEGDPSEVQAGAQRLVRADFSKKLNDKLTMHQSTLVLLVKGQIVSFTFIADTPDAIDNLIDGLVFSAPKSKVK